MCGLHHATQLVGYVNAHALPHSRAQIPYSKVERLMSVARLLLGMLLGVLLGVLLGKLLGKLLGMLLSCYIYTVLVGRRDSESLSTQEQQLCSGTNVCI